MSEPMVVDFFVAVPNAEAAALVSDTVIQEGYGTRTDYDEQSSTWPVVCSRERVLTYDAVADDQTTLDVLGKPFGGVSDG